MDVVEQTLSVVRDCSVVLGGVQQPPPPQLPTPPKRHTISQLEGTCGVVHMGVVAGRLHHVVGDTLQWGYSYKQTSGNTTTMKRVKDDPVWKYAHLHFDVAHAHRPVAPLNILDAREKQMLKQHSVFNLRVLDTLMTCVQDTPHAPMFLLDAKHSVGTRPATRADSLLSVITHRWVTPGLATQMGVILAGQAVAHALLQTSLEATYLDVWAPDADHITNLIAHWRERFGQDMCVGVVRSRDTIILVRPGVKCVVRARVVDGGEEGVVNTLCALQPDFTQCMYRYGDGGDMVMHATPRALLALKTKSSMANEESYTSWIAEDTGLSVTGVSEVSKAGKPCQMEADMCTDSRAWNMISQHMCVMFSSTSTRNPALEIHSLSQPDHNDVHMLSFVTNPNMVLSGMRGLYVDAPRLRVEDVEVDEHGVVVVDVSLTADPGNEAIQLMERLHVCMNTLYPGSYIRKHTHLRVKLMGEVVHAASGGDLARVPHGCSIGGRIVWNCLSTTRDASDNTHELLFKLKRPRVYPCHVPR